MRTTRIARRGEIIQFRGTEDVGDGPMTRVAALANKGRKYLLTWRRKSEILRLLLRGGPCLQFFPLRRRSWMCDAATFHNPLFSLLTLMRMAQTKNNHVPETIARRSVAQLNA